MSDDYRSDGFTPEDSQSVNRTETDSAAETASPAPAADQAGSAPAAQQYIPGTQAPQYQRPAAAPGTGPIPSVPPVPPIAPAAPYQANPVQGTNAYPPAGAPVPPAYPQQPAQPPVQAPPMQGQNYAPYQQPVQPVYQNSAYTPYPVSMPQPGRGLAIASLVLGIVSIIFCATIFVPIVCGVVGLILGILAKSKGQGGMAIAGIVLSALGLCFTILIVVFGFILAGSLYDYYGYDSDWLTAARHLLGR